MGDRIYAAVKRQLLSGEVRPRERLDAARIAERHAASITPVRAALHRLVGEGLVVATAGEGFHTPGVSEAGLRDLYTWNGHCLQMASRLTAAHASAAPADLRQAAADSAKPLDLVARTEHLFAALGRASRNEQCAAAIEALNDRLCVPRSLEARLFEDTLDEWSAVADAMMRTGSAALHRAIASYHRRRVRAAPNLVRLMHRPPPPG